ncbi:pyrrolysine--tRNA(Pyl) ligase large subunit [Paradesulfitobacterium aromaticivorans]
MSVTWTVTQKQKLIELNGEPALFDQTFTSSSERDQAFQKIERELVQKNKQHLLELKNSGFRPLVCQLESKMVNRLNAEGFVQVVTPIMLAKGMLEKMTITQDHPLSKQVFWVDDNKCLRPMLAPNLYYLMHDLNRLWGKPVRIFEVGPCFRKESQGANHLNEFTMLNLVELGTPEGEQTARLRELAAIMMDTIGLKNYKLETDASEVYDTTIDVVAGDLELGSGAYGPHKLDPAWGIVDPWVGIGFGVERLAMALQGHRTIRRVGRSLSYLDGSRLNI